MKDVLDDAIERAQDHTVTVSLLLTMRCNFQCEHCMYSCGPKMPATYMNSQVLSEAHTQVSRLQADGIYPEVNLIGGEPTYNMDRFAEILREVSTWGVRVFMSTNGWWLERVEDTRRFLEVIGPYAGDPDELSVRISQDNWHDRFRPHWLRGDKLAKRLAAIWEWDPEFQIFEEERYVCPECGRVARGYRDRCSKCHSRLDIETTEMLDWTIPEPNPGNPWIYVENWGRGGVLPQGRAESWGDSDPAHEFHKCWYYGDLSYLPNGKLMDICCRGSWLQVGTTADNPLTLLGLSHKFIKETNPDSCRDCRSNAAHWKRRGRPSYWRKKYEAALE